jgi:hypothetical protein
MFDCVKVNFPRSNSNTCWYNKEIPFVDNYLTVIKSIINDIKTSHFWMVASFVDVSNFNFDYIPEQFEQDQIHCWYNNDNKEGNVLLIPRDKFLEQINSLKFLRDYKDVNYHFTDSIVDPVLTTIHFDLQDPIENYNSAEKIFYNWFVNRDLIDVSLPNFFPSFWDDVKLYTFGKTKDIQLIPYKNSVTQFYDYNRQVNIPYDYSVQDMDVIFISYDEPSAEQRFKDLQIKAPRAKWVKNVQGQTEAYHAAAEQCETAYFFAVFPKLEIVDSFNFDFQPDRLKNACHYMFNCRNPVNGLEYGHGAVLLYNKKLTLQTTNPGLDFTLSAPHTDAPILSAINHFNETPWLSWRTAFREVLKLKQINDKKPTVESQFRLKKWCSAGTGKNAECCLQGAQDANQYYDEHKDDQDKLQLSYDFQWLKEYYERKYVRV